MTEHAVNNGTSICQTTNATHLILSFKQFRVNKTVGLTYSGDKADLEFYLVPNNSAPEYCLSLYVNNISNRIWYGLIYKDPLNKHSASTIKEIPAKTDVFLYCLREFMFEKQDELIVFLRFGRDNIMLQADDIDQEQMMRLWGCLELLHQDPVFADTTVNGYPAHRALLAAASEPLYRTISALTLTTHKDGPSGTTQSLNDKTDIHVSLDKINGDMQSLNDKTNNISVTVDTNHNGDCGEVDNAGALVDKSSNGVQDSKILSAQEHCNYKRISVCMEHCQKDKGEKLTALEHCKKDKEEAGLGSDAANCKGAKSINGSNQLIQTDSVKVKANNEIEGITSQSGVNENNDKDDQNTPKIRTKHSLDVNVLNSVSTDNIEEAQELKKTILEQEKFKQDILLKFSEFMGKKVGEELSKTLSSLIESNVWKTCDIEAMENPNPDNYKLELPELRFDNPEFLKYIYTGCVELAPPMIDMRFLNLSNDLLAVAQSLMLEELMRKMEQKLINSLNLNKINNYLSEIMDLAERYNLFSLKAKVMTIMRSPEVLTHEKIVNNPLIQKCILKTPRHEYRRQCCVTITLKYPDWKISYSPDSTFRIGGFHGELEVGSIIQKKFDADIILRSQIRKSFRLDIKICPLTNENSPMKNEKNDIIWYYERSIMLEKSGLPDKNRLCCVKDIFKVLHDDNKVLVYMEVNEDYEGNIWILPPKSQPSSLQSTSVDIQRILPYDDESDYDDDY